MTFLMLAFGGSAHVRLICILGTFGQPSARRRLDACYAYFKGFDHAFGLLSPMLHPPPYCVPNGVNVNQGIDIVVKELKDHPETRHLNFGFLILQAMSKAFPCKTK